MDTDSEGGGEVAMMSEAVSSPDKGGDVVDSLGATTSEVVWIELWAATRARAGVSVAGDGCRLLAMRKGVRIVQMRGGPVGGRDMWWKGGRRGTRTAPAELAGPCERCCENAEWYWLR